MTEKLDIEKSFQTIGEAVVTALHYEAYPLFKLNSAIKLIDQIINDQSHLLDCEIHFKSGNSNYVLFYISTILYNLKTKSELKLTPEILKWLGSVWKNFLIRNKSYQDLFKLIDEYRGNFLKYYPAGGVFVNQIDNVHLVKQHYIDEGEAGAKLKQLEKFYHVLSEVISWMKPTYFFLLDYYYEISLRTGTTRVEATVLEKEGLGGFGQKLYNYFDLSILVCQALGVLEAIYLTLKKKSSTRQIITIEGKQKFMTAAEIYSFYLEKFNKVKKEIKSLA